MRYTIKESFSLGQIAAGVVLATSVRTATPPVSRAPARVTAFVNVAVVPMDRDTVLSDQTVLIEGGRIAAVGPVQQVQVPVGAVQIDGRGKFLLPGLADMHAHLFGGTHIANIRQSAVEVPDGDWAVAETKLFMWLANGVTTIRNLDYSDEDFARQALKMRAQAAAGTAWFPRIYTAGPWGPVQYLFGQRPDVSKIADYVAHYKAAGYDVLKVHDEDPQVLDSVLAAAKRVGVPVTGHVPPPTTVEHVLAVGGYKCIEHPVNDYRWHGRTKRSPLDTTGLTVLAGQLGRAGLWNCPTQQHYDRLHYEPAFGTSPKILKVLQDSGVKLLLGTDEFPWQGVISQELRAMVAAGLTPYQALLTGTRNVAEYWGTLAESGTIAVGKRADLVLLTGNPLEDVRYTAQPAGVMLGGRWLSRADIARRAATLAMPTFTDGHLVLRGPVKRYWQNVADEVQEGVKPLFYGVRLSEAEQRARYQTLQAVHERQWQALVDSLGTSDHYAAENRRLLGLLAQQLGADRAALPPEPQVTFDANATPWMQRQRAVGDTVAIPGVPQEGVGR